MPRHLNLKERGVRILLNSNIYQFRNKNIKLLTHTSLVYHFSTNCYRISLPVCALRTLFLLARVALSIFFCFDNLICVSFIRMKPLCIFCSRFTGQNKIIV